MWDMNNDQSHADYYADFLGVGKTKDGSYDIEKDESGHALRPSFQTTFLTLSTTRIILCTSGISCGTFRANKMICRD
jgi:hypothetical protein